MKIFLCVAVVLASLLGVQSFEASKAKTVDLEKVIVRAHGFARTKDRPEESALFQLTSENRSSSAMTTVPKGKKLIVTDFLFDARHMKEDVVINLNQRIEDKTSPSYKKTQPLQQVALKAGESREISLCTGYVIHAGNGIVGWTNAGLMPDQGVQMNFTGYLIDEDKNL